MPDTPVKGSEAGKRYLIAAGTEQYPELGDDWRLPSVPADLDGIVELFCTGRNPYERALPDLNVNPTSSTIRHRLHKWITSSARSRSDLLLVYYSGHGDVIGDTFYMLTADTAADSYSVSAFDSQDIVRIMREGPVRQLLIILDACYSGEAAHKIADTVIGNASLLDFAGGEGIWVLAASRPREETPESIFARALINAVNFWRRNTSAAQPYLAIDTILRTTSKILGDELHPYSTYVGSGSLPPFFPNPEYDPSLPLDIDLETRSLMARFSRELLEYWATKARGVEVASQAGWLFTGRERALGDLERFLTEPASAPTMHVLTGDPGSGKSAVLGQLVLQAEGINATSGTESHRESPSPRWRLDAALLARRKTVADLYRDLRDALGLSPDADPVAALKQTESAVLLLDALDEAVDPGSVIRDLLTPLLEPSDQTTTDVRVVVGTRKNLLNALSGVSDHRMTINLDSDDYLITDDITSYVTKILTGYSDPTSSSPYRGRDALAGDVAREIAEIADKSFLVAQLAARTLAHESAILSPDAVHASRHRWHDLDAAFDRDLERFGTRRPIVRDLLAALAWGEGSGIPRDLWPAVATAVSSTRAYADADVTWLIDNAPSYVVEALDSGRAVYRLYHQQFADHFLRDQPVAEVQRAITTALLQSMPTRADQSPDWAASPPYIRTHLSAHAAAAGLIDTLIEDLRYLIHADPSRLISALPRATSAHGREIAAVYRRCGHALLSQGPEARASQLELTAHQLGRVALASGIAEHAKERPWQSKLVHWSSSDDRRVIRLHEGPVGSLSIGTVGTRTLVANGHANGVALWDFETGEIREDISGDGSPAVSAAIGMLGEAGILVAGRQSGEVSIWDIPTGRLISHTLPRHFAPVQSVNIMSDGNDITIASADRQSAVCVWDPRTGNLLGQPLGGYSGHPRIVAVGGRGTDPLLVDAGDRESFSMWRLGTARPYGRPLRAHSAPVSAVALGELDGKSVLITGDDSGVLFVWDIQSQMPSRRPLVGHRAEITAIALGDALDRTFVISGDASGEILVWDLQLPDAEGWRLRGHQGAVLSLALGETQFAQIVALSGAKDGTITSWEFVIADTRHMQDSGEGAKITAAAASRTTDGRTAVVIGDEAGLISIYDTERDRSGRLPTHAAGSTRFLRRRPRAVTALAASSIDLRDVVVSGHKDGRIFFRDLRTGAQIARPTRRGRRPYWPLSGDHFPIASMALTAGAGRVVLVVSGWPGKVWFYSLRHRRVFGQRIHFHSGAVSSLSGAAIAGQGLVLGGGWLETLQIWRFDGLAPSWQQVDSGPLDTVSQVAMASDLDRIVFAAGDSNGVVAVWELRGDLLLPIGLHDDRSLLSFGICVRDSIPILITGGTDGSIRALDARSGRQLFEPIVLGSAVRNLVVCGRDLLVTTDLGFVTLRMAWLVPRTVGGDDEELIQHHPYLPLPSMSSVSPALSLPALMDRSGPLYITPFYFTPPADQGSPRYARLFNRPWRRTKLMCFPGLRRVPFMRLVDRLLSIAIVLSLIEPLYVRLGEQRQSSLDKNLNRGLSDVMNVMSEHLHTTNDWLTPHLASTFSGAKASQVVVLYPAVMILTLVLIRRIKVSRINLLLLIIAVTVGVAFMVGFVMHVMASDLATLRESVIGLGWRVWFGVLCSYAIVRSLAGRGW